jgi:hypothetical protein
VHEYACSRFRFLRADPTPKAFCLPGCSELDPLQDRCYAWFAPEILPRRYAARWPADTSPPVARCGSGSGSGSVASPDLILSLSMIEDAPSELTTGDY